MRAQRLTARRTPHRPLFPSWNDSTPPVLTGTEPLHASMPEQAHPPLLLAQQDSAGERTLYPCSVVSVSINADIALPKRPSIPQESPVQTLISGLQGSHAFFRTVPKRRLHRQLRQDKESVSGLDLRQPDARRMQVLQLPVAEGQFPERQGAPAHGAAVSWKVPYQVCSMHLPSETLLPHRPSASLPRLRGPDRQQSAAQYPVSHRKSS